MDRRGFLKLLGAAPVAASALGTTAAPAGGSWSVAKFGDKEIITHSDGQMTVIDWSDPSTVNAHMRALMAELREGIRD